MPSPYSILFVCRHNSMRSQIAEVLAHKISRGAVLAQSAGPEPTAVPEFIQAWANNLTDAALELSSNSLDEVKDKAFDLIITLCDKTHQALPELSSDQDHIRWDFQHADTEEALRHLEIELAERIRLLFLTKKVI